MKKNILKILLLFTVFLLSYNLVNAGGYGISGKKGEQIKNILNNYFAKYEKKYSKEKAKNILKKIDSKVVKLESENKEIIEKKGINIFGFIHSYINEILIYSENNSFNENFSLVEEKKIEKNLYKIYKRHIGPNRVEFKIKLNNKNLFQEKSDDNLFSPGGYYKSKVYIIYGNENIILLNIGNITYKVSIKTSKYEKLEFNGIGKILKGKNGDYILEGNDIGNKSLFLINKNGIFTELFEDTQGNIHFGVEFVPKGIIILKNFELLYGGKIKLYLEEFIDDKNNTKKIEKIINVNDFIKK